MWIARRLGARWIPILISLVLAAACGMPLISARSSLGSLVLLMLATGFGVWFAMRSARLPAIAAIGLTALAGFAFAFVGAWWHASWSGLALMAAIAWTLSFLVLSQGRWLRAVGLSVAGTAGLLAGVLAGPLGGEVWERSRYVYETCRGIVTEWMGAFADGHVFWYGIPTLIMLAGSVVVLVVLGRRLLRVRHLGARDTLTALLTGQAMVFAVAGLVAVRFTWMAAFMLVPVVARCLSVLMAASAEEASSDGPTDGRWRRGMRERTSDPYWRVILVGLMVVLVPVAVYKALPHSAPGTQEAVALLPADCRLFSTDLDASAVLIARPDVTVWVDGRTDYWGRERLVSALQYFATVNDDGLVPEGTTCVLLPALGADPGIGTDALVEALLASPDWAVLAQADDRIIWVPADAR